ncbi:hypothetical protein B0F90DRAFT_1705496 [Multifurca ochricompacta]|uniref:Uncharacterized protein n=1 Tax=Multifurca ochricompacta TaxID=376703 RepID=A0AAD4M6Y7_9AGAM|nr:hypothetical protein B0F90DRAFT_1705496 [Multifurca ochricompacta]
MGFFSSRRNDPDAFFDASSSQHQGNSSPGIIRSRFYGKNKGKSRETNATPTRGVISPLAGSRKEPNINDSPPIPSGHRSLKESTMRSPPESLLRSSSPHQSSRSPGARASTDAITLMLAQRLAELASANAEGLLDDDEYRLLRQNLFERLGNSTLPQENPVVPTAGPSRPRPPEAPRRDGSLRTPSMKSKRTMSSSMSGLLRRAASRRNASTDTDTLPSDSTSLLSAGSNAPNNSFARRLFRLSLSKQSSIASLRVDNSSPAHDNASTSYITSPSRSDGPRKSTTPSISRSTSRSKRQVPPPPSAFHQRVSGTEQRRMHSAILDDDLDDEELKSSKEIRAQIEAVEAEGRRLMDAFNGLELSALTRRSQASYNPTLPPSAYFLQGLDSFDSAWSFHPPKDTDGMSMRSTTSNGTSLSAQRSPIRTSRTVPSSPLVSQPISLGRKSSLSSVSSMGRSGPTSGAPRLPALPSSLGRLWVGSSSSVNLTRSAGHLPLAPVAEGDSRESIEGHIRHPHLDNSSSVLFRSTSVSFRKNEVIGDEEDITALEGEMTEIRRRRAEVMGRYDERLGYLRAKLKGAELHEKLLRL